MHNTGPTRVTNTSSIDHLYSNFDSALFDTMDFGISGHKTILCEFTNIVGTGKLNYVRSVNNIAIVHQFLNCIRNEDWNLLYKYRDIDSAYDYFKNTFSYYFNVFFPKEIRTK